MNIKYEPTIIVENIGLHASMPQNASVCLNMLQYAFVTYTSFSMLQYASAFVNILKYSAVFLSILQYAPVCLNIKDH